MREVIRVNGEVKAEKPVEFTYYLDGYNGWENSKRKPIDFGEIVYLGHCSFDGDMFSVYDGTTIEIYKGHLNSGKY